MKTIIKKEKVEALIDKNVTKYVTDDGEEFGDKETAERHEDLLKKFPKVSKQTIEWLENLISNDFDGEVFENLERDHDAGQVIVEIEHSAGENPLYEAVEPSLKAVRAVIKALHRKTVGCGCNRYVNGVIYKGESLGFDDGKKTDKTYYQTGQGRNIKDVLSD